MKVSYKPVWDAATVKITEVDCASCGNGIVYLYKRYSALERKWQYRIICDRCTLPCATFTDLDHALTAYEMHETRKKQRKISQKLSITPKKTPK